MTTKMRKKQIMAVAVVVVMLFMGVVPFTEGSDASVGDGEAFSYTITYDSSKMTSDQSSSSAISVDGMEAILYPSYSSGTVTGYGSWTWNATTGYGPFNSFYAAFNANDGNKFVTILNPFDLAASIDSSDTTNYATTGYNIMWVLPTVYITSTSTSLTLSSSGSDSTAYAHTIDGHTYNYIAIGVYEGTVSESKLMSTSGTSPTVSTTRENFRTYAHNYTMDSSLGTDAYSMQWNFYQWQLYKYCCWTLMENFNSQAVVGGGHTYGSTYVFTTGATNTSGPYAGTPMASSSAASSTGGDSVKLFIENAWGGVMEFVDGVVINGRSGYYIDTSSTPTDSTTTGSTSTGGTISYFADALPSSNGYPTSLATTNTETWGMGGSSSSSTENYGLTDYTYTSTSSDRVLYVGGGSGTGASISVQCGLSCAGASVGLSYAGTNIGSRLAFVFDAGPASSYTVDIDADSTGYGAVDSAQSISDVASGTTITITTPSGGLTNGSITIGNVTVTASLNTAETGYTNSFLGWYSGSTLLSDGDTVTANMTITATFTRTINTYTVTVLSSNVNYGTVTNGGSITGVAYNTQLVLSADGMSLTIGSTTVVAVAESSDVEWTYSFDGYYDEQDIEIVGGEYITASITITAEFSQAEVAYVVLFQSNNTDYGTVDYASISVHYNTAYSVNDKQFTVGTRTVTASVKSADDQYTYAFVGWYDAETGGNEYASSGTVTANMSVYARFSATVNTYTASVVSSNTLFGTVSPASVTNVPYGTSVTVSSNTLDINGTTVTATPKTATSSTTFTFEEWQVGGTTITSSYTITGATTFTAVFSDGTIYYTVNFSPYPTNGDYGTISPDSFLSVPYGSAFTVNGTSLTLNGYTETANVATADDQYTYAFAGWYDAQTGGNEITSSTTVSGTMTAYARFTATVREYTLTIASNNTSYGTVSPTTLTNVPYGSTITYNGTALYVDGRTVSATPATATEEYVYSCSKWQIDGVDIGSGTTTTGANTITAVFVQGADEDTAILRYNANGGKGTFADETYVNPDSETSHDFTVISDEPTKVYYEFAGWATSADATSAEYEAGDTVTVSYGEILVLYAVWEENSSHSAITDIVGMAPILAAVGVVLGIIGTAVTNARGGELSGGDMLKMMVGGAIVVLLLATLMIPIIGSI